MSKGINDKDMSDIEKEFEEEMKKEKLPKKSRLPEETELEKEYNEEIEGEELLEEKELDPFAAKFYELSTRTFKTETELDNAVNRILNEIERNHFFKGLFKKTKKTGKLLLKKGLKTFKDVPAFQAAKGITQLARGNLKGTLGTLAKASLKEVQEGKAVLPVLDALGFEAGKQNKEAWQNFTNVCKDSFDYLAKNLNEKADDPLEASKLASEAFRNALKKVKSERKQVSVQRIRRVAAKLGKNKVVDRTVAIVLGMICIVLVAGLVGAFVVYVPMVNNLQSQMTEKDNAISSLNNTISSLNNTISSLNQTNQVLQYTINQLSLNQSNISYLEAEIAYLTNIVIMNVSEYLMYNQAVTQAANETTTIFNDMLNFAGYVSVAVQSSSNTTYVEAIYSSYGINYDNNVTVGTSGTAAFPVLPGLINIIVGNTETADSVDATITATYQY